MSSGNGKITVFGVFLWGLALGFDINEWGFAKKEFKSYILIDFAHTSKEIIELFDDTYNLDFFFLQLQQLTGVRLYEKESVIIFDEVQLLPKARQAIKYLVADGRYKYIETGSLLSIRKNTKDILIPSEEHKISMYPMDFEEFLWAIGDEITADTIKILYKNKKSAGNTMHQDIFCPMPEKEQEGRSCGK